MLSENSKLKGPYLYLGPSKKRNANSLQGKRLLERMLQKIMTSARTTLFSHCVVTEHEILSSLLHDIRQ